MFAYIIAIACFLVALYVFAFTGEDFMIRYLSSDHHEDFDVKRFKIVYSLCFLFCGIYCLLSGHIPFLRENFLWIFIFPVLMNILIFTWCKKK